MQAPHYLSDEQIRLFLVQLLVLLGTAKILGGIARRYGSPALAGEILAGILLGPTVFGRLSPNLQCQLFPPEPVQRSMMETLSWFGVLFLLLITGFEVKASTAWRQGRAALSVGVIGVIVPLALGLAVFAFLPDSYWGPAASRLSFSLFLATAASISALTVIARVLHDLDIVKSDLGLVLLSGYVVNDLLGWLVFTVAMGLASQAKVDWGGSLVVLVQVAVFATICLTSGSRVAGSATRWLKRQPLPQPATVLAFITCLGVLCGIITLSLGIQAILGFFLAGVMAGNTPEISERERDIISQLVHAIFVPIFFASLGLHIDFVSSIDIVLLLVFTTVAVGGKFVGAWLGARLGRMPPTECVAVGVAFIPGGAMEVILGLLALELALITPAVFVAIVFAALASSVAVGPLLARALHRLSWVATPDLVPLAAVSVDLAAATRQEAIARLCAQLVPTQRGLELEEVERAVREREDLMGTAIGSGVAVPHARCEPINRPLVGFGLSRQGLEWDAPDGQPVHFVFLLLTPSRGADVQVRLLAAIATLMADARFRDELMGLTTTSGLHARLQAALRHWDPVGTTLGAAGRPVS